ncbi:MAG: hypothetical protein AAFO02_18165 [Bacteroidota bacterium]
MKQLALLFLLLSSLIFFTSCDDEDFPRPPCELVAEDLKSRIDNNAPEVERTRIETGTSVIESVGVPWIKGCIAQYEGVSYNLEQLISYQIRNETQLILKFP